MLERYGLRPGRRGQMGMTLIEVLISILIFAIGVLGLVALQAKASQISSDSEDRNRAALLANEAVSLMWENQTSTLPTATLTAWQNKVSGTGYVGAGTAQNQTGGTALPNGVGTITFGTGSNSSLATIMVQWQAPSHPAVSQYITQVIIE